MLLNIKPTGLEFINIIVLVAIAVLYANVLATVGSSGGVDYLLMGFKTRGEGVRISGSFSDSYSYDYAAALARVGLGKDKNGYRREFIFLVETAKQLQNEPEKYFPINFIDIYGSGARSKQEIMEVVNTRIRGLRNIYNLYLKRLRPDFFDGDVGVKFTVGATGEVIDISIVGSTTGYAEFDNAIRNMVRTWKWKAIKSGDVTSMLSFKFRE